MAFTVDDFQDLVRLLEQRPEWRAELRRLVLTDDLLDLPTAVRELVQTVAALAEAQRRTAVELSELRQTVGELAEAQRRTEADLAELRQIVGELAQAQRRTEAELGELRQIVGELAEAQRRTEGTVDRLDQTVAALRGSDLERRYRDHAGGYFGRFLRRVRVVRPDELDDLLDEGVVAGALHEDDAHDVRLADLVVRGRRPDEDRETYLVVEVSAGIGPGDVERAARRASLLGRLRAALPVVAGEWLTPDAATLVETRGVWQVLDGRVKGPGEE